ncbi:DUF6314 family protein [Frondihabitans australicus]|uniref:DUF6314 family protein n=1 Tax=Frondihabitans australicus TaxID=386892 RepID=UPI00147385D6|nr:DUF6314 family protein [Frondihabitans australicus]
MPRGDAADPATLPGVWRFERTIDDRLQGRRIHVAGTATFAPRSDGAIAWDEEGLLDQGGDRVPVAAHRLLRRDAAGAWAVEFADGRPFHPWRVDAEVVHDCAPDDYRGRIDAEGGAAAWTQTWNVTGPMKDYTMVTRYEPCP